LDDKYNDLVSVSQNELDRVLRLWEERKQPSDQNPYNQLYKYIHPLVFGSVDRASSLSIKLTTEILS
jgi:CRISPR/Cas system CMR-associated protein Cmr1 (group 7 of RAMP superfamily)